MRVVAAAAVIVALVATCRADVGVTDVTLPAPARFMWGWGENMRGYCGSFSFQTFGIMFGNYISAQPMRDAADGHELLLGDNDEIAAENMKFSFEAWKFRKERVPQAYSFVSWAASHIDQGHGVVVGMFEQKNGGDGDYDHIMPVMGYRRKDSSAAKNQKRGNATTRESRDDVMGIYYHDLFRNATLFGDVDGNFVRTRNACGAPNGVQPDNAPYEFCLPENYDYGIALMGNRDDKGELFPARLEMPSWTEPDYGNEDQLHQPVVTFRPDLVISGLSQGLKYTVLRFDHASSLPTSDFLGGAFSKRFDVVATSDVMRLTAFDEFLSDATVFYRVVLA